MKKLFYLFAIGLFLFSCQSNNQVSEEDTDELTKNRKRFAEMALNSTAAIEANWESLSVLSLTFKQNSLKKEIKFGRDENGNDNYEDQAFIIALTNAVFGRSLTGMSICVRVQYPDGEQLAYECVDKKSEP